MIKLKDILSEEDFGKYMFGDPTQNPEVVGPVSIPYDEYEHRIKKLMQYAGYSEPENNTPDEDTILRLLLQWLHTGKSTTAMNLSQYKTILKRFRSKYSKILKPDTPNGTYLYRGTRKLFDVQIEALTTLNKDGTRTMIDIDKLETHRIGSAFKYIVAPNKVRYKPHKPIQSWTSKAGKALAFNQYTVLRTKQNDDFFFNQNALNILYDDEYEVIHFGDAYKEDVEILINTQALPALKDELDALNRGNKKQ